MINDPDSDDVKVVTVSVQVETTTKPKKPKSRKKKKASTADIEAPETPVKSSTQAVNVTVPKTKPVKQLQVNPNLVTPVKHVSQSPATAVKHASPLPTATDDNVITVSPEPDSPAPKNSNWPGKLLKYGVLPASVLAAGTAGFLAASREEPNMGDINKIIESRPKFDECVRGDYRSNSPYCAQQNAFGDLYYSNETPFEKADLPSLSVPDNVSSGKNHIEGPNVPPPEPKKVEKRRRCCCRYSHHFNRANLLSGPWKVVILIL